jgi:hypothetical protein
MEDEDHGEDLEFSDSEEEEEEEPPAQEREQSAGKSNKTTQHASDTMGSELRNWPKPLLTDCSLPL